MPAHLHEKVFEPRVTSKLDTMVTDRWGVHGRGMALFSVRSNVVDARVAASDSHRGMAMRVVSDATALPERADQSSWPGRFVGAEPDKDLAVLRIEAPAAKLRPIAVGSSADLQVGQKVFAIGNPFGLDQTLTTGIISALKRQIRSVTNRPIQDVVQTAAAINPGNSGGPLLDSGGRLIGVNTSIYSPSGSSAGTGFAVPVDTCTPPVCESHQRAFP